MYPCCSFGFLQKEMIFFAVKRRRNVTVHNQEMISFAVKRRRNVTVHNQEMISFAVKRRRNVTVHNHMKDFFSKIIIRKIYTKNTTC